MLHKLIISEFSNMDTINKVIRLAGMKRNGNHAIVNWILAQHTGPATFRNAANKFEFMTNFVSEPIEAFKGHIGPTKVNLDDPGSKEIFMITYEDRDVEKALHPGIPERYENWMGHRVNRAISMVVLRDPFNFFASRIQAEVNRIYPLKSWGHCFSAGQSDALWEMWITYARKYLEFSDSDNRDEIAVSYNRWVMSPGYRKQLAGKIDAELINDGACKTVTGWGAGSSFNGKRIQEPEMYLNRWRKFREHVEFKKLLENEDVLVCSNKIFGPILPPEEL